MRLGLRSGPGEPCVLDELKCVTHALGHFLNSISHDLNGVTHRGEGGGGGSLSTHSYEAREGRAVIIEGRGVIIDALIRGPGGQGGHSVHKH